MKIKKHTPIRTACVLIFLAINLSAFAQGLTLPRNSPKAEVGQTVGITEIHIRYSRPNVVNPQGIDRTGDIWGKLVPFGFNNLGFGSSTAAPWRAGADENTIISFSHDVKVEGQDLPAGEYGLHMALEENGQVTVIFSKNTSSWGSYFYDEKEDALRVTVASQETARTPLLTYSFPEVSSDRALIALDWEKKRIPIQVEVNTPELTYASLREELRSAKGFTNQSWARASNYLLQQNTHLEEALQWAENAISHPFAGQRSFTNYQTKASILRAMGRTAEAEKMMQTALALPSSTANDYYGYGRSLIRQDRDKEALAIFKQLSKKWKNDWLAPHGLARGYSALGDMKKALKYEKTALEKAPASTKASLEGYIKTLSEGKDFN